MKFGGLPVLFESGFLPAPSSPTPLPGMRAGSNMKTSGRLIRFRLDHCIFCSNCGFPALSWAFLTMGFKVHLAALVRWERAEAPLVCCCFFSGVKELQTSWQSSRTLYNHHWELCKSHFSLTCEEHTAIRYTLWPYRYLSWLTLCEFDTEFEFSGNSAEESLRSETFHCQKK